MIWTINIRRLLIGVLSTYALVQLLACEGVLDTPLEMEQPQNTIDYSISENMILPLIGIYGRFYNCPWHAFPMISFREDGVNNGGLGDSGPIIPDYDYDPNYWMFNTIWVWLYQNSYSIHTAIEEFNLYYKASGNPKVDQYTAEAKVIRAWHLLYLSRMWDEVFIPRSSDPAELLVSDLSTKDEVMRHISAEMDDAITFLPDIHPKNRTDIPGGVTKYTALAIKAIANLELKNYQVVAEATSKIIESDLFSLEPDFYELFKLKGKLNNENILEIQYSDFGKGEGPRTGYLFAYFGPQNWSPKVEGAKSGWGFYEPSFKYVKFMLERDERIRLETSVLFTNRGLAELKSYLGKDDIPSWMSNITPSGDTINDFPRAYFSSGKHYLPSDQLTPGRTIYGTNKNLQCIRYAEILLMHAEALTQGASGNILSADDAVNLVRRRAGLESIYNVNHKQVMDEKFAELAMEWGVRYYDMIRLKWYDELSYDGRVFTEDKIYYPYPLAQVEMFSQLSN